MANNSAVVDEIWKSIEETRIDIKQSRKQFRDEMIQSRKRFQEEMKQSRKRFQEEMKQSRKEFRRHRRAASTDMEDLRATVKETAKQLKKTDRRFNTQWGRLVESLVEGSLVSLLNARGIEVRQTSTNIEVSTDAYGDGLEQNEFDIVVLNGTEVVVVEVKTTLTPDKVNYFVATMEKFKRYFPEHQEKRVYGAVAYLRSEAKAKQYADRKGLFVIRATGDSASIMNGAEFKPKAFPSQGAGD